MKTKNVRMKIVFVKNVRTKQFKNCITKIVFSYEQTLMSDLVRFWYGGLFLFASYYTFMKDGHVRVDLILMARIWIRQKAFEERFGVVQDIAG